MDPPTNFCPSPNYETSIGSFRKCEFCNHLTESTAEYDGQRICELCSSSKFPERTFTFKQSDAKFKCPAPLSRLEDSGAKELSYRDYWIGSCCENALERTHNTRNYDCFSVVNRYFYESKMEEDSAKSKVTEAEKKLVEAKKQVELAEKNVQAASEELNTKKIWRTPEEENKPMEDNEKLKCKVCFELYDDDHLQAAVSPCGHKACFQCLSSLPQKTCPTCRADFTADQILKLFD
ncbi:Oidioi.mRNA.OKI2018_I69.PAR.g11066.t2.cds [Oikopleura dioica]|uniref:Oidioi.mRNA.OKI2018_I69.PAR.g11066.t2.cds n=1 Tax=Oikopleura dioica TaxID=34765 RepID=A0ABN7S148_OIKDI|nr:Oidioi.mRNA.OKI2018_I69.PAR.g11066.t2.cds [Oikopleura dioica]